MAIQHNEKEFPAPYIRCKGFDTWFVSDGVYEFPHTSQKSAHAAYKNLKLQYRLGRLKAYAKAGIWDKINRLEHQSDRVDRIWKQVVVAERAAKGDHDHDHTIHD